MNKRQIFAALVLEVMFAQVVMAQPTTSANAQTPYTLTWIDRPWEYRYLLYVSTQSDFDLDAKGGGSIARGQPLTQYPPNNFKESWQIVLPTPSPHFEGAWSVLRLDSNKDRHITNPSRNGQHYISRLNKIKRIVLVPDIPNPDHIIEFGIFAQESADANDFSAFTPSGNGAMYTPTICLQNVGDKIHLLANSDRNIVDDSGFTLTGVFGCREWATQLYDINRPYIDVTSYQTEYDTRLSKIKKGKRKGKYPLMDVTYVHSFIGFSRFQDPPKPVIGQHAGQWLCFNDCPNGDAPGLIADIKAWAGKQGWSVPERPRDVRRYKDKKASEVDVDE